MIMIMIIMQASRISVSFGGHTAHCGTESEHQVLDGSNIFISLHKYWYYLVLRSNIYVKGEGEEGKQSGMADIQQLVLTFCPTMHFCLQWRLKLLMPVLLCASR